MGRFLLLAAIAVVLAGCGGREATAPGELRYTRIDWLGNECFRITSPIGTSILTNPYASKTEGRSLPANLKSDVVLITSESPRRNNVNAFSNQPAILRGGVGIGINNVTGIGVLGVPVYRDPELASSLGMNLVYAWTMDGIRYCFIESPVRPLDTYQLGQIGRVDVLLLTPAGVGAALRKEIVSQLKPRLLIPVGSGSRGWVVGNKYTTKGTTFMLARQMLPAETATLHF